MTSPKASPMEDSSMKACPFCGESDTEMEADQLQGTKWGRVVCRNCGGIGPEVRTDYDTSANAPWHAEAIEEWNRRTDPVREALVEALEKIVKALCSDAPSGPQKTIIHDDTIYHLDGQKMYPRRPLSREGEEK
jgi:Lar family restriction alleviation protein